MIEGTGSTLTGRQAGAAGRNSETSDLPGHSTISSTTSETISRVEFAEMIAILCESKLHVELTKPQMLIWWRLLSPFDTRTIREAILRLTCRSDPFPNAGAIYEECRRINGAADERTAKTPSRTELNTIADALGWR